MADLRNALFCARLNFIKWWRNPMVASVAVCWLAYVVRECLGLLKFCNAMDARVTPWVLPFLSNYLLYVPLLTIFFAHAPFSNQHAPFTMIRTGKRGWFIGQVMYIAAASLVAVLFTYGVMLAVLAPRLGFDTGWGSVLTTVAEQRSLAIKMGIEIRLYVNLPLILEYGAIEATLLTILMRWLVGVFVGSVVLFFNVVARPGTGVVTAFAVLSITLLGGDFGVVTFHLPVLDYVNILAWCNLSTLQPLDAYAPSLPVAILILLGGSIAMMYGSLVHFCRHETLFETDAY